MVEPPIAARMEQAHYFASVRVNPRQIRAFTQVAVRTGESEIVCIVITTVLARSNVLYVEAQFGKFLREPAILTALARPRTAKLAQLDIHSATRRWDVAEKREPQPLTHLAACSLEPMKPARFVLPDPAGLLCSVLDGSRRARFSSTIRTKSPTQVRLTLGLGHPQAMLSRSAPRTRNAENVSHFIWRRSFGKLENPKGSWGSWPRIFSSRSTSISSRFSASGGHAESTTPMAANAACELASP
jgi:hypothetical protein